MRCKQQRTQPPFLFVPNRFNSGLVVLLGKKILHGTRKKKREPWVCYFPHKLTTTPTHPRPCCMHARTVEEIADHWLAWYHGLLLLGGGDERTLKLFHSLDRQPSSTLQPLSVAWRTPSELLSALSLTKSPSSPLKTEQFLRKQSNQQKLPKVPISYLLLV